MDCRSGGGACCIAPSISSPIPGMPAGKPAGVRCIHLARDYRCWLFGRPERPEVCRRFQADPETCGDGRERAGGEVARIWNAHTATSGISGLQAREDVNALEANTGS